MKLSELFLREEDEKQKTVLPDENTPALGVEDEEEDISPDEEEDVGTVSKKHGFAVSSETVDAFGKTRKVTLLTKDEDLGGLNLTLQYVFNPKTGAWKFRACLVGQTTEDMVDFTTGEDPSSLIKHLRKKNKITAHAAAEYLHPPANKGNESPSEERGDVVEGTFHKKSTLQKILEISNNDVLNFRESQETRFDKLIWKHTNLNGVNALIGIGQLNKETFELYIEPRVFTFNNKTFNFLNLGFAKIIDGIPTQELQHNSTSPSAVIGAVKGALWDKVKEYEFDALTLIAATDIKKRMRAYNHIARSGWANKNLQTILSNVKLADGSEAIVLLTPKLAKSGILPEFEKYLASLDK